MKLVSRQNSSIWEAQCAHRGDIPSEGFISSYSSLLQRPFALCCLCSFLVSVLLPFSNMLFHYAGETGSPELAHQGCAQGGSQEMGRSCPLTQDPHTDLPMVPHGTAHLAPLPAHLPAKKPLLARVKLTNTEGHWVMKLQPSMLFVQVPCTHISDSTPREISSKLANKFCSLPA